MAEMTVNTLTIDLLQDQAAVSLVKQGEPRGPGKPNRFTAITVNVPVATPGNEPENRLKRSAVEQAKLALQEAIRVLDKVDY